MDKKWEYNVLTIEAGTVKFHDNEVKEKLVTHTW